MTPERRRGVLVVLALGCAHSATALAGQAALDWETAFPIASAAPDVYLDAHFVGSDGTSHRLQLWRHGTAFVHRRTDESLDLYLSQVGKKGDYAYRLVDHRRRVSTDVRRNQLYRIGVFSDWFGLAHVLDRPKSEFVVRAIAPLPKERQPKERQPKERQMDCSWRILVRGSKSSADESRICWSTEWGLPLAIRTRGPKGEWIERFTVDRVETISPAVDGTAFPPVPDGYAYFDAGNEIDPKTGD